MSRTKYHLKATIYDKKNNVIATATNSFNKTHPIQSKYALACGTPNKVFLHAEILCLIRARGKGYKMVVERYNKAGKPVLAKPCPICQMALQESQIKRIEYTL
jgi:tRNA(Arg) A34 adenosine deaminase TadA